VDRFVRLPGQAMEGVLSLVVSTSVEGVVHVSIVLEYVVHGNPPSVTIPLAIYPLSQQAHAQEDALLLARRWELSLRRARPGTGWEWVRIADEQTPDGGDLIIGG
jgi:hypothetical protein